MTRSERAYVDEIQRLGRKLDEAQQTNAALGERLFRALRLVADLEQANANLRAEHR